MTDDVATVAAGLTKAQRETMHGHSSLVGCVAVSARSADSFIDKGLAVRTPGYSKGRMLDWTPLGLSVRDHILKEQG